MGDTFIRTEEEFKEFKGLYKEAVDKEESIFIFKGNEILVKYAKYLLEHLENRGL